MSKMSPWGEFVHHLLRSEALARRLDAEQHADNVRYRCGPIVAQLTAARDASRRRREQVLKHEDLRARLCAVLGVARADRWNGWVPPAYLPEQACRRCVQNPGWCEHGSPPNRDPIRAALVEIATEAHQREGRT